MQAHNTNAQCTLACAATNPCVPPCSPPSAAERCAAVVEVPKPRPERLFDPSKLPRYLCGEPACNVFGGHDYYPEELAEECGKATSPRKRGRNTNLNTLGSPVGMVKSTFTMRTADGHSAAEMSAQRFATYLKAFAMIYLTPENEWDSTIIDTLLREGQILYTYSMDGAANDEAHEAHKPPTEFTIYSEDEAKIQREFDLNGYVFGVELSDKYTMNPLPSVQRQFTVRSDFTIAKLRPALKGFFRCAKYCLMRIASWYLLIWKTRGIFFVFDFYGRRPNDFYSDRESGVAMLICLKHLDNVMHLLQNLSNIQPSEPIQLRELKVVKLRGPDGKTVNRDFGRRSNQYVVISPDYAYLTSALHLNRQQREPLRSRSALPIAVAALIAAKIDHPATWNRSVVEKIICFGVNMCQYCWDQCQYSRMPIEIERFPAEMKLGQFLTRYTLTPRVLEGVWKCVPNYTLSELMIALEKCFENNMLNLIIQIGPQIYAFWKKHGFFYLLDPYRHRIVGALVNADLSRKTASVRMFRSLDGFMGVFTQILLEYTKTSPFQIHSLKINRLEYVEKPEGKPSLIQEVDRLNDVTSLNETICFEEDSSKCKKLLAQITEDDEEDDIAGALQLDLKEPKTDSEQSDEDLEEEEGGMEGMGEYETSSSGDDDDKGNKRQGGGADGAQRQPGGSDRVDERPAKGTGSKGGDSKSKEDKGKAKANKGTSGADNGKAGNNSKAEAEAGAGASNQPGETSGKAVSLSRRHSSPRNMLFGMFSVTRPSTTDCPHVFSLRDDNCNYPHILKELRAAFKHANRLEVRTPWARYDIYRADKVKHYNTVYICQKNAMVGSQAPAEQYFNNVQDVTKYMIAAKK